MTRIRTAGGSPGHYDPAGDVPGVRVNTVPPDTSQLAAFLLDAVVESVPVGVLLLDGDLNVIRANAALCELVGTEEAAQLGRSLQAVLPWIPEAAVRHAFETGVTAEDIALGTDDDAGLAHRFTVSLRPLSTVAGVQAVACIVRDVADLVAWRRGLGGIEQLVGALSGAATQAEVTEIILERSRDLIGADTVAAVLHAESGDELEIVGTAGLDERTAREWSRFDLELRTPTGAAVRTGEPIFLEGDERAGRRSPTFRCPRGSRPQPSRSEAGGGDRRDLVPVPPWPPARAGDRSVMVTLGGHYGQALDRARLFEAAESERQRLGRSWISFPLGSRSPRRRAATLSR